MTGGFGLSISKTTLLGKRTSAGKLTDIPGGELHFRVLFQNIKQDRPSLNSTQDFGVWDTDDAAVQHEQEFLFQSVQAIE